jgi:AcrR family transcriptional regulator
VTSPTTAPGPDGRTTRWDSHRAARRAELVTATLRAIRRHGATVGMDEIARVAGTSKTVFYRHFGDRAGLYRAVAEAVDARLLGQVGGATTLPDGGAGSPADARALLRAAVDTYLGLVEEDPEVYRFIVAAPLVPATEREREDPARDVTDVMSARMAQLLAAHLVAAGRNPRQAATWGQAVVGLVRAVADGWLRTGASSSGTERERLVDDVVDLLWEGLRPAWSG